MNWEKQIDDVLKVYHNNKDTHLEDLKALTRIPGVSFSSFPRQELDRSAEFVKNWMEKSGLTAEIIPFENAPHYVLGEKKVDPKAPTILLYAHYDVQPSLHENLWTSPPFEPTERNGRLYARGIADDKAGIAVHLASIHSWLQKTRDLPINLKVFIEGEEEVGSPNLEPFLDVHADKLKADCLVIMDSNNYETGQPSLTTSLRGMAVLEVTVSALKSSLHSGMWGGPLPDPAMGLSKILSQLTDNNGNVTIPELLQMVTPPTPDEMQDFKQLGMNRNLLKQQAGVLEGVDTFGEDEGILKKLWREPSLVINSIEAGGRKIAGNVILDSAWARIGLRLAPGMDPKKSSELLEQKIRDSVPWGLNVHIEQEAAINAWKTNTNHPVFELTKQSLSEGYGHEAVFIGCGGSIPWAEILNARLGGIPVLLVGIEDPYTNAHSENESLDIKDFHHAVESQIRMFAKLADKPETFSKTG